MPKAACAPAHRAIALPGLGLLLAQDQADPPAVATAVMLAQSPASPLVASDHPRAEPHRPRTGVRRYRLAGRKSKR